MAIIIRAMTTTTPIIRVEDVEPSSPPEPTVVRVVEGVNITTGGLMELKRKCIIPCSFWCAQGEILRK